MSAEVEFIFTFGIDHPLGRCYTVVRAATRDEARQRMFDVFGLRWAFQYDSREAAGVERWGLREIPFEAPNV